MTCSRVSLFDYDVGRLLQLVSRNRGIVGQKTLKGEGCLTHIAGHELPPHRRAEIACFQQRAGQAMQVRLSLLDSMYRVPCLLTPQA
jgi:hypothetical protein